MLQNICRQGAPGSRGDKQCPQVRLAGRLAGWERVTAGGRGQWPCRHASARPQVVGRRCLQKEFTKSGQRKDQGNEGRLTGCCAAGGPWCRRDRTAAASPAAVQGGVCTGRAGSEEWVRGAAARGGARRAARRRPVATTSPAPNRLQLCHRCLGFRGSGFRECSSSMRTCSSSMKGMLKFNEEMLKFNERNAQVR